MKAEKLFILAVFGLITGRVLFAESTTILNFDAIDASHGRVVAGGYLKKAGIALGGVTPGTLVVIDNAKNFYEGRALAASSAPNVLTQINSNDPVTYTLTLAEPALSVRFTRPALFAGPTGITFPEWRAEAIGANGALLDRAGEPLGSGPAYYSDVPARTFLLKGPGITAVRFSSNNRHFAAFSALVIDDLAVTLP